MSQKKKQDDKNKEKSPYAYEKKIGWDVSNHDHIMDYAQDYIAFLSQAKTERESVGLLIEQAEADGFTPFDAKRCQPGDKFYFNNRNKGLLLGIFGRQPLTAGFHLVGAHVDAPRLDIKGQPLYQEEGMAMLKTHYYGGIKKYQWVSIPLAIHGMVVLADGSKKELVWGEADHEPVFTITDLLPHLAKDQMKKPMNQAIEGEGLNVLFGGIPLSSEDGVKENILKRLHTSYGIKEEDFISAELEVVPSGRARHVGLDQAFVGGYGQDDRVCAYAACRALGQMSPPERTALVLLSDKEEIGSFGDTGAQGRFLEQSLARLADGQSFTGLSVMGDILSHSQALSADVSAGVDPNYKNLFDPYNAPEIGKGVVLTKYTGSGGKYSANDASAEMMAYVRQIYNEHEINWQAGELGKVDAGGGGTIAMYLSQLGIETVDSGPALLGMHSPFEIADKSDIYHTYLAYKAFLERS